MAHPLGRLRRGRQVVTFHRSARLRRPDALAYVGFWANDPAAMATLRQILADALRSAPIGRMTDAQVLEALAGCIVDGSIVFGDGPGYIVHGAEADGKPAAPPPVVPAPPPAKAPAVPETLKLSEILAALEAVAIEAADVKPEIEVAMAAIDLGVAKIGLASVSLAPTPTKIPDVATQTAKTSLAISQTIDGM